MNANEAQTLKAKLQQFADELTLEERAQIRSMQTKHSTDPLAPSLRAKAQQAADALTPEERAQLYRLLQGTGAGVAAGKEADVEGQMIAQYDDGFGNKGRPRPVEGTGGGGTPYTLGQIAIGFLGALALGLGLSTPGSPGDPPPPGQPPLY